MNKEDILTEQSAVTVENVKTADNILKEYAILEESDKAMRTAFIRVAAVNHVTKDIEELNIKANDIITYSLNNIITILKDWEKARNLEYYVIQHNDVDNSHYHIVIKFPSNSPSCFKVLKHKFPFGYIDTCRTGVKNCVRYLVHADHPEKTQYDWDSIVTNNPTKLETYKIPGKDNLDIETKVITDKILAGELREFEIDKIPPEIFTKKYSTIMRTFEYKRKLLLADTTRNVEVIVLQGKTRLGKSTFCKAYAEKHGKSIYFSSSGRDFFGELLGQEVAVIDDTNYENIEINDLKKIIDPHLNCAVVSRYHNKLFTGDTIFICTNQDITTWYPLAEESDRAAVFERIKYVLHFQSYDELLFSPDLSLHDDIKIPEYSEGASYYTINKIVPTDSYKDVLDKKGFIINSYRERKLEPVDGAVHEFDLKKYITADEKRGDDCLAKLTDI